MKAIAIIELPDDGFEKGKWYIDGEIRYTENESLMKKFDAEMIPLKPLPHKLQADWYTDGYKEGFNSCLDEIAGETE